MCKFTQHAKFYQLSTFDDNFCKQNLDPDEAQQNVGPDLDPNCLTLKGLFCNNLKIKKSADDKRACKITQHAKIKVSQETMVPLF